MIRDKTPALSPGNRRSTAFRVFGLACCLVGCLAGCASSPSVRFYDLVATGTPTNRQATAIAVGVGPILFPEYLERPQIVTRDAGNSIQLADFDRWVEPLDTLFQRVLIINLDNLIPDHAVIAYPFHTRLIDVRLRITVQINQFDVDQSGNCVLDVQWTLSTVDEQNIGSAVRSRYSASTENDRSYAAIVGAMNQTLDAFSRELADRLQVAIDIPHPAPIQEQD